MIIGFGHRKQVGKDFACRNLAKQVPGCKVYAFADKLYDICHQLYGWAGFKPKGYYDIYGAAKNVFLPIINKTPRQILVELGTPAIRGVVYDNTWIDYLMKDLKQPAVISDVRFPNEVNAIKELGGMVVRIDRPCVSHTDDAADIALASYEHWDLVINNDDNFLQTLESEVLPWLE